MKNSNAFILPSLWEEIGFVIVEAALCNTSIISSNCKNGPVEILDNNMENLQIMGFENKIDAMRSVYDITDQFHRDINGGVE